MITVYQLNGRKLTDDLTGWDSPAGKIYCDVTMQPTEAAVNAVLDFISEPYVKVAEVNTLCLDNVYSRTQHVSQHWFDNPTTDLSTFADREKVRSTSMGDVLVKDGVGYLVAMYGFIELSEETTNRVMAAAV